MVCNSYLPRSPRSAISKFGKIPDFSGNRRRSKGAAPKGIVLPRGQNDTLLAGVYSRFEENRAEIVDKSRKKRGGANIETLGISQCPRFTVLFNENGVGK